MGYYENIAACRTEKELLELWRAKEPVTKNYMEKKQQKTVSINHKNVFISDGIVNEEVWNSQNGKKILYVLKEAYGEIGDLTEWLLRVKPTSSIWKRVIEWTYGIQNTNTDHIAKYSPDIYEHHTELFNNIAVVNLKKSGGKSSSNYGEIEAYALADSEEIKGLWCDNWFYYTDTISDNKTLVIDYYHPANYYPALVNYYAVINIFQQALF